MASRRVAGSGVAGSSVAGSSVAGSSVAGSSGVVAPVMGPTLPPDSGVRLSEIKEGVLDDAELRTLFSDIATYGTVQEVTMKMAPRSTPEVVRRLPELYLKLIERRIYGAQIRYEFESGSWLDTLITTPSGCRLVRVRLPD